MLSKAQKEERKKKAEENHAEELEINQMKIEMEREQHKATLDVQMAQITALTQVNMKMIEFLTSMMVNCIKKILNKHLFLMNIYVILGYDSGTSVMYSSIDICCASK